MIENVSEAQKAVLGCVLQDSNFSMPKCIDAGVTTKWFWDDAKALYEVFLARYAENKITDLATIPEKHLDLGTVCVETVTTVAHLGYYIDELRKEHMKDRAHLLSMSVQGKLENGVDDIEAFVEQTAEKWANIRVSQETEQDMIESAAAMLDDWQHPDPNRPALTWPLESMSKKIGHITDQYIVIASMPSVGKTALALEIQRHLGYQGIMTSMAQLESPSDRVLARLIGNVGSVNTWKLSQPYSGTPEEFEAARQALNKIKELPINITFTGRDIPQLRVWAQNERKKGSRLLIIDNLINVRNSESKNKTTVEVFMERSQKLKQIRDDVGLPLIVLHHLGANGDMAWSSNILRDVDIAIYLTEDENSIEKSSNGPALDIVDFNIVKNRDGDRHFHLKPQFIKCFQQWKDMENPNAPK